MTATFLLSVFCETRRALTAGVIALACVPAFATVFTNNTTIGVGNTNYDGTAIVVTNCTLTVDGPHTFSSVQVAAGGVLTHSVSPSGAVSNLLFITNESQVLSSTNPATLLNSNVVTATVAVTDSTGTIDYTNGVDYLLSSTNDDLTELELTTNSSIPDGATVLVSYEALLTAPAGLTLTVTNNVEVDVGGAINANGNGYGGGLGAGAGNSSSGSFQDGSGAGYGGTGGMSSSNAVGGATYGSFTQPANLGSGGGAGYAGSGGAGGGMIEIVAGGSVIVNGSISANGGNGTNARSGGGSGGSVWLTALTLFGSGTITANGGSGDPAHGGGGGGGRIAVQCEATDFAGSMAAYGGAGANIGGAGTVYTQLSEETPLLVIDNGGQSGANTPIYSIGLIDMLVQGNAGAVSTGGLKVGNLTIASNSLLLASPSTTLELSVEGALTIEAGGGLLANSAGYVAGVGPGAGGFFSDEYYPSCGGGGYGGNGASGSPANAAGGASYGSQAAPTGFGSGGGTYRPFSQGGNGGGAIQITSLNSVVQVDGTIAANGGNGSGWSGGGGSGGTITLTGGTLLGSGSITANGGNGANTNGGGGGGGRMVISPTANLFGGTISAYGGDGANWGGAGTVVIAVPGQIPQLILDNGGNAGTNTPLQSASATDLIVRGGAIGSAASSVSFDDLYLNANGWLLPFVKSEFPADTLAFSFSGNATVEAGGGIVADFAGYAGETGPGEGRAAESGSTWYCSGGGHGGYGGNSFGNYAAGGITYDSGTSPSEPGSGGGAELRLLSGGPGGGVIRLTVLGTLEMDGIISANGGNGSGFGGGGSGGSIWLAVGTLSGAGSIAANGGSGADALGGGGGGGMIYIPCNNDSFSGTVTAYGGGGANWGGTGTTIIQVPGQHNQLILDSGGHAGPATPLPSSSTTDLTLRNGAVGLSGGSLSLGNVLISSNAWLLVSNAESYVESVSLTMSSATIEAGGGIIADFQGYAAGEAGEGGGAGRAYASSPNYPCSGGGLGGNGGNSIANSATGGLAYDNQTSPTIPGSGGGTESPYSVGGAGGGAFHLTVTGLLQVDGTISANGGNGGGIGGGGGSGGSIWLTSGTLSGAGSITANGGSGAGSVGGGGGGGSIAIYPTVNQFAGTISAYGGGGANWGGAGTVFIEVTGQNGQLILDNDGQSGATTPIQSVSSSTGLTLRKGAVGSANSYTTLGNVLVSSNAWLLVSNTGSSAPSITMSSATIEAGGGIIADSQGYPAGEGSGVGRAYASSPNYPCSGAGHGGNGGNSIANSATGGVAYDNQALPTIPGSGGGTESPYSVGGAGGGAFWLTVTGLLQIDGAISANGGNGGGIGGGGGSGGSIKLTVGTLSGSGSITANGGSGAGSVGGGGAGGCIAIYPTENLFTGAISAYGGGGANWGGAGTVYIQTTGQTRQFILDNGGQSGAATPIQSVVSSSALILSNGAVGYQLNPPETFASLLVSSNGWLMANPISANNYPGIVNLTVTGNATVEAGGGIVADNAGSAAGLGVGAGNYYYESPYFLCSGAGYGGYGAVSAGNSVAGGSAYGSITSPTSIGSGGGNYSPYSIGGAGGGSIRLYIVDGTLDAAGRISANGGNGSGFGGGGGSGGSIWLTVGTLAGAGSITANGGSGADGVGGGGGGGRISIAYAANDFAGLMTAYGGGGYAQGGAGTIYTQGRAQSSEQLLLDNGGEIGTNTPLSSVFGTPSQPFNLTIGNGAIVCPQTSFPLLNNLTVASGGLLTISSGQTTLDLLVFNNVDVESGGVIAVDGEGYSQTNGPGAGQSLDGDGSGAGYGGTGGASATVPGGASYGSSNQPVDFGSGGGLGEGPLAGGSEGGGALRFSVGGILTVDGQISADGEPGLQDNSGGGSGGSLWVTAGTLAGSGQFTADGGAGELYGGGGGGGGRIALYSRANIFFGLATANGAGGDFPGADGTICSNNVPPLQVLSNSPVGIVSSGVSSVTLYFNDAPNPNSFPATAVSLTTPNGPLSSGSFSISMLSSASYLVSFPLQTAVGNYVLTIGTNINDLYGQPMSQVYTGAFTISLPVIQGAVTDTNSQPVAGVLLEASDGLSSTTTDTNGNYALGFVPGSSFTVTPSLGALVFLPGAMSYTNVSASISNQNYLAVSTLAPVLTAGGNATNLVLNWQGLPGVNYQVYCSTDLVNWQLVVGAAVTGSNGPAQIIIVPTNGGPAQFFSVQSSY